MTARRTPLPDSAKAQPQNGLASRLALGVGSSILASGLAACVASPQPALTAVPDGQRGLQYAPASVAAAPYGNAYVYGYNTAPGGGTSADLDRLERQATGVDARAFEEQTFSETQEDLTARRYAFEAGRSVQPRPDFFQRYNFQPQAVGLRADAVRPASYVVQSPNATVVGGVVAGPATYVTPPVATTAQYVQPAYQAAAPMHTGQPVQSAAPTRYVAPAPVAPPASVPAAPASSAASRSQSGTVRQSAMQRAAGVRPQITGQSTRRNSARSSDAFAGMSVQAQTRGADVAPQSAAPQIAPSQTYAPAPMPAPAPSYAAAPLLPPVGQEANYSFSGMPQMPPARPGQCFALVRVPEEYRTVNQQIVTSPGYDRYERIPAQYQTEYRQVTVRDGYEQLQVTPPTFGTVTGRILERPGTPQLRATQPVVEQRVERILVKPAQMVWKRGRGPVERIDHATGEIMCLVEEPAVYQTVTRNVVVQPAQVQQINQPDVYRTVTQQVVTAPPQVQRVQVPPQVATVAVQRLVRPESTRRVAVPPQYSTIQRRELVRPASLEWRAVLCETNLTPAIVRQVQTALQQRGYPPGPIDGIVGPRTMAALKRYQQAYNLPTDNYINIVTARHLGLPY